MPWNFQSKINWVLPNISVIHQCQRVCVFSQVSIFQTCTVPISLRLIYILPLDLLYKKKFSRINNYVIVKYHHIISWFTLNIVEICCNQRSVRRSRMMLFMSAFRYSFLAHKDSFCELTHFLYWLKSLKKEIWPRKLTEKVTFWH